ncbi:MAG: hypothetical protein AAF702_02820 [Chloroflexota bacterium]
MLPFMATTASESGSGGNFFLSSLLAGVITAFFGFLFVIFFGQENPLLYGIALLLIGVGPVLGYGIASGNISVGAIIGGLIGSILLSLLLLGAILWPFAIAAQGTPGIIGGGVVLILSGLLWSILVGALERTQSVGRLLVGSIIGSLLAGGVFLAIATNMGQDPSWLGLGIILLVAVWGGTCGAAMSAWAKGR